MPTAPEVKPLVKAYAWVERFGEIDTIVCNITLINPSPEKVTWTTLKVKMINCTLPDNTTKVIEKSEDVSINLIIKPNSNETALYETRITEALNINSVWLELSVYTKEFGVITITLLAVKRM
jgi:S-methylmethionine-dependent homocysteine/selenocysteine methylase